MAVESSLVHSPDCVTSVFSVRSVFSDGYFLLQVEEMVTDPPQEPAKEKVSHKELIIHVHVYIYIVYMYVIRIINCQVL